MGAGQCGDSEDSPHVTCDIMEEGEDDACHGGYKR